MDKKERKLVIEITIYSVLISGIFLIVGSLYQINYFLFLGITLILIIFIFLIFILNY